MLIVTDQIQLDNCKVDATFMQLNDVGEKLTISVKSHPSPVFGDSA
jgi:hypothetical protein